MTPLETSIHSNHSFKMGIAIRIPEEPGRKPGRRPGSDPEVETDIGKRSLIKCLLVEGRLRDSQRIPKGFPEDSRKVPGRDRASQDQLRLWNFEKLYEAS